MMNNNMGMGNAAPNQEMPTVKADDPNFISKIFGGVMHKADLTPEQKEYEISLNRMTPVEREQEKIKAEAAGDIAKINIIRMNSIEGSADRQIVDHAKEANLPRREDSFGDLNGQGQN